MSALPPATQSKLAGLPWFTVMAGTLAVAAWFWPGAFEALAYDRGRIFAGQVWRIVTGHWVHFSASHLFWNLVILIPAGTWLERRNAAAARWTFLLSPLAISLALLAFNPALGVYAGISGVASGILVALAVHGLRAEPAARWLWLAVLVLFVAKVGVEGFGRRPLNPDLATQGVAAVPLAHLVGAAVGAAAVLLRRRRSR
jgi:rhomboid family GlyGly-CTERM serine protease